MKFWKKDEVGIRKIGKVVWGRKRERKIFSNGIVGEKEFGKRRQKVQKGFRKRCCVEVGCKFFMLVKVGL